MIKLEIMNSIDGRIIPTLNGWKRYDNGGKGSGNFGHSGRPGKVGGSGKGMGSSITSRREVEMDLDDLRAEKQRKAQRRLSQHEAEKKYYDEFETTKKLDDDLYSAGFDDARYGLQALDSQYQSLLYHETISSEAAKELRKGIRGTIKDLKGEAKTIRKENPKLAKAVEDRVKWFEENPLPDDWND